MFFFRTLWIFYVWKFLIEIQFTDFIKMFQLFGHKSVVSFLSLLLQLFLPITAVEKVNIDLYEEGRGSMEHQQKRILQ